MSGSSCSRNSREPKRTESKLPRPEGLCAAPRRELDLTTRHAAADVIDAAQLNEIQRSAGTRTSRRSLNALFHVERDRQFELPSSRVDRDAIERGRLVD